MQGIQMDYSGLNPPALTSGIHAQAVIDIDVASLNPPALTSGIVSTILTRLIEEQLKSTRSYERDRIV